MVQMRRAAMFAGIVALMGLALQVLARGGGAAPPEPPDAAFIPIEHCPDQVCIADTVPNDPLFSSQYGPQKIHAPTAWDTTTGTAATVVAVVDTGIDCTHGDITGKCTAGYDFVSNLALAGTEDSDDYGHGTHVACIAACKTNNGVGVAGVCWQCRVMPVKVLNSSGSGTFAQVASGIRFAADNGASVINMSLGGCPSGSSGDCGVDPVVE